MAHPSTPDEPLAPSNIPSQSAELRLQGVAAAPGRIAGQVWIVPEMQSFPAHEIPAGHILVTSEIMPEQLVTLQRVAGVVTEQGGLTSHAAILARELGFPAIVGAVNATQILQTGDVVLLDGDRGEISLIPHPPAEMADSSLRPQPPAQDLATAHNPPQSDAPIPPLAQSSRIIATRLMVNLSQTQSLCEVARLPIDGVGLLRAEMMMLPLLDQQSPELWIQSGRQAELSDRLAHQIVQFADAFAPRPIYYRSSDRRSHESRPSELFATAFEQNPVLGLHGTLSYQVNPALFDIELAALQQVQQQGFDNVHLLLPFVRTVDEFTFCRRRVEQANLFAHPNFQLWIMAEVPSVLFLLPDYVQAGVQGISIGSNDLMQLILGIDRNQPPMSKAFDARHPAVLAAMRQLIQTARSLNLPCSICGQAPGLYPDLIEHLVRWGIGAISVSPDAVETTFSAIARAEKALLLEAARQKQSPEAGRQERERPRSPGVAPGDD